MRYTTIFLLFVTAFLIKVPTLLLAHTGAPGHTHTVSLTLSGREDAWLPTADETLTLTASISDLGNALSSVAVKFELKNVSAWKGTAMNSEDDSTSPDLAFLSTGFFGIGNEQPKAQNAQGEIKTNWNSGKEGDTSFVEATCPDAKPTLFTVKIRVKDYAAYGELTATLSDGAEKDWASHTITIPKDTNGNYIGDAWQGDDTTTGSNNKAGYDPDIDSEVGPGATQTVNTVEHNANPGDGFVVFEEYRGFFVNGLHQRLDPHRKDVFVHSEFSQYGIGDASNLPAVFQIHQITEDETKDTYKDLTVNFHALGTPQQYGAGAAWHVLAQFALWVRKSGTKKDNTNMYGEAEPISSSSWDPGPPARIKYIHIYNTTIEQGKAGILSSTPATIEAQIWRFVIGHEIGHGLQVYHPWPGQKVWHGFSGTTHTNPHKAFDDANAWDFSVNPHVMKLNTYTPGLTLTSPPASYMYEYGTSIMDYPLLQIGGPGIFPDDTYHVLHNWEYNLIPYDVQRRETSNHTRRTTIVGNAPHVSTTTHTHDIHEDTSSPSELPTITNIAFANAGPYHAFANNAYMPIRVASIRRAPRATTLISAAPHRTQTDSAAPATAMPASRIRTRFQRHHRHPLPLRCEGVVRIPKRKAEITGMSKCVMKDRTGSGAYGHHKGILSVNPINTCIHQIRRPRPAGRAVGQAAQSASVPLVRIG